MKLTDTDLKGYGRFREDPATFTCQRYHLPAKWDYVYTNGKVLLRVCHDGGGYLQVDPPGGPAIFRQERSEPWPMLFTWIVPEDGKRRRAFSNFWLPTAPAVKPGTEPDEYACTFSPDAARYRLKHDNWTVETELWVPPDDAAVVMTVSVTNASRRRRGCTLIPALKPHLAPFSLAPWDKPEAYQTAALCRVGGACAVWMETRNPAGDPSKRLRAALLSDLQADAFEVSLGAFAGAGEWGSPEAVWEGKLARRIVRSKSYPYGKADAEVAAVGQPIVAALARTVTLAPNATSCFTVVLGKLADTPDGRLPPKRELTHLARFLKGPTRERALDARRRRYRKLFGIRSIATPDVCLNRYVNEWLPLQLEWVTLLDRGWPTGMRGTRDAAQDATGIVPIDPEIARARLIEILSCQRTDGWFLRQYSTTGPDGTHDHRPYVDSAIWVWELLMEYLSYTRDFRFLKKRLRWLDTKKTSTVLDHVTKLFDYYLARGNLGEHGLCKIRGGDWNDSVNAAGLEGRGESVMVSCQVVLGLEQAADLMALVGGKAVSRKFRAAAKRLRANVLKHARNRRGYFNAVFNDAGKWIFSPKDPDGRLRVNGPANSFAVIAGLVHGRARERVFDWLNRLKGPNGWRLFHPAIADPPIDKLGRIGSGDKAPGLSENGTCYNHGAHGFLGRAAWTAGRGRMLHDVLRYMFSYDQQAHPVKVAKIAPYAVPNHWKEAVGQDGVGGDTFLSGSISTALRNVYQGLVGFRPGLEELVIDPCVPSEWEGLTAEVPFLDGRCRMHIWNPRHVESGVREVLLDGKPAGGLRDDKRLGRRVGVIPIVEFKRGRNHVIDVTL
ncbi:MAG TPA: hypothetical protein VMZ92_14780 [Planctomycetota bacterium]|nr:hypothetical protein [Planctomycetota bacterium]